MESEKYINRPAPTIDEPPNDRPAGGQLDEVMQELRRTRREIQQLKDKEGRLMQEAEGLYTELSQFFQMETTERY